MIFGNPTYLWALVGLLVPLLIHLWNKKEGKTIQIGSIQLLNESDAKQSKSLQLNELILLLLRLLIVGILALILAAPQIEKKTSQAPITYIVESSLIQHELMKEILDSISDLYAIRVLQIGFPLIEDFNVENEKELQTPPYWQLAQEMKVLQTDSIVVFTKGRLQGIQGTRPEVQKKMSWIIVPTDTRTKHLIKFEQKEKGIDVISIATEEKQIAFSREHFENDDPQIQWNATRDSLILVSKTSEEPLVLSKKLPVVVEIFYEIEFNNERRYFEGILRALSQYVGRPITVKSTKEESDIIWENTDLVIWLNNQPLPKTHGNLLMYQPDFYATRLIEKGSSHQLFYLTDRLVTDNIIRDHLAAQLLDLLDLYAETEEKVKTLDQRTLALEELLPQDSKKMASVKETISFELSNWLWPFLVLIFIGERGIAKWRGQ